MKNIVTYLIMFLLAGSSVFAQVGINTDNSGPDPSAMLDVKSTNKGLLPPRMTTDQMNSIDMPAQGLIVYNITVNSLYWYNGSAWTRFNEPYSETDPVFTAHPAFGITTGNISNWNTAYGWGNHATAGYLTSFTETDPVFGGAPASGITAGNITNWNTAFINRIMGASGSLPLTLFLSGNQLSGSIAVANSTTNGYLTSTDWNTFNNKISSQWTTGTSAIYYNGGNVGIGTSVPHATLQLSNAVINRKIVLYEEINNDNQYFGFGINPGILRYQVNGSGSAHVFCAGITASASTELMRIQGNGTVGIGTFSPDASALLDVTSTSKGLLPPRMTTAQRNTIASPAEGLVIYNTDQKTLNVYNGTSWKSMTPITDFACGSIIVITHTAGAVAPVNKTVVYGTVIGIPGEPAKCWITSNLGSDHQATSVSDGTEASAGWYWQFNRKQGYKHDGTTRTPNTTWISSISETSDWFSANDPCTIELSAGWRIPTYTEWYNVDNTGNWTDWNGPWGSGLKLHAAGYLYLFSGSLSNRGSDGYYWSSKQDVATYGWYLDFYSGSCGMFNQIKTFGFSARCVRDY